MAALADSLGLLLSRIGRIEADPGLRARATGLDEGHAGPLVPNRWVSFDHFRG